MISNVIVRCSDNLVRWIQVDTVIEKQKLIKLFESEEIVALFRSVEEAKEYCMEKNFPTNIF